MSEFADKVNQVRTLLRERNLEALVIRRNPNLAWLIAGRVHVPTTIDMACFDLVITHNESYAVTNAIEAPRLIAEEFPEELNVKIVNWWEGRDSLLPNGNTVGTDQPGGERVDLGTQIERLRQSLSMNDAERLRAISEDAAIALGDALKSIESSDREIDVAGAITHALWQRNLDIAFLGVAGAERVMKYRHPLPTTCEVGERVVASICARRTGLIASVTRIVVFGQVSPAVVQDYHDLLAVEAAMLGATVVGSTFSEPISAAVKAYSANNFADDEWQKHHQGGPTGYLPRDWPANLSTTTPIAEAQPIAWNPTGKGWKVEDTILARTSGIEILSNDPTWPHIEIAGRSRPNFLQR